MAPLTQFLRELASKRFTQSLQTQKTICRAFQALSTGIKFMQIN